jgi:hypothetical protein
MAWSLMALYPLSYPPIRSGGDGFEPPASTFENQAMQ